MSVSQSMFPLNWVYWVSDCYLAVLGSQTALLPYAQERYLQNHIIMGAIDKLHKVYSTTFEPLVWARSVGVEVLNELDSVKAALMMTAGARKQTIDGSTPWSLAAKGVETLVNSGSTAKNMGGAVSEILGNGLQWLAKGNK